MTFWERFVGTRENATIAAILAKLSGMAPAFEQRASVPVPAAPAGINPRGALDAASIGTKVAFTIAIVALGAKMAKADGRVTPDEVDAFKEAFTVAPEDMTSVGRVFDLARKDTAGYEAYADQIGKLFRNDKLLLQDVLEGLFHVAVADGDYHPGENAFLARVAAIFELPDREFQRIRAEFVADAECHPLDVLGLPSGATQEEARAAWKRLVRETHPDALAARGLPEEAVRMAEKRLIAVNRAWERLRGERPS